MSGHCVELLSSCKSSGVASLQASFLTAMSSSATASVGTCFDLVNRKVSRFVKGCRQHNVTSNSSISNKLLRMANEFNNRSCRTEVT